MREKKKICKYFIESTILVVLCQIFLKDIWFCKKICLIGFQLEIFLKKIKFSSQVLLPSNFSADLNFQVYTFVTILSKISNNDNGKYKHLYYHKIYKTYFGLFNMTFVTKCMHIWLSNSTKRTFRRQVIWIIWNDLDWEVKFCWIVIHLHQNYLWFS